MSELKIRRCRRRTSERDDSSLYPCSTRLWRQTGETWDTETLLEEIIAENVPNLMKTINHTPKKHSKPWTRNMKKATPSHAIIKLLKTNDEEKALKAPRERRRLTYRGTKKKCQPLFFSETMWVKSGATSLKNWSKKWTCERHLRESQGFLKPERLGFAQAGGERHSLCVGRWGGTSCCWSLRASAQLKNKTKQSENLSTLSSTPGKNIS